MNLRTKILLGLAVMVLFLISTLAVAAVGTDCLEDFERNTECPPTTTTTVSTTAPPSTTTTPPTTSTVPPSTTTTTTGAPTTTTATTAPPSTTTSQPPATSSTTTPPPTSTTTTTSTSTTTTTTTVPSSTVPPTTITIDVTATCDNRDKTTDILEPITTQWGGNYQPGSLDHTVEFVILDTDGNTLGNVSITALPTYGFHDVWFEFITEPVDYTYTIYTYIDGTLDSTSTAVCSVDPPPTTTPPPELPHTGRELYYAAVAGSLLLLAGTGLLTTQRPKDNQQ